MSARPRWAEGVPSSDFLALREGSRPFVVVAPHGGRRRRAIRRGDSVNDLHTANIAWELAERLDAHAIVNHGLDRNEIDFNRISHLARRAPDVLRLLEAAVRDAGSRGEVPFVLFVHGWNMVVACCDIGIGLRRRGGVLTGRFPTLSRERYDGSVSAIERELDRRGLRAAIGRRYTASGSDNAAQLFSGRHSDHEEPVVAGLARLSLEGRVDAAQLELGIPVRWPGARREALLDGLVAALTNSTQEPAKSPARGWVPQAEPTPAAPPVEPGYSLQAVLDSNGEAALFSGVEATGLRSMAARFCIVCTDGSMMLLVGEGEWNGAAGRYDLDGFLWSASSSGRIEIIIDAPMVRYPTHDAYLDLEDGLAASEIVEAKVALTFDRISGEHGRLRGTVIAGGVSLDVDTIAFPDRGGRRAMAPKERMRLLVALSETEIVIARSDDAAAAPIAETAPGIIRVEDSRPSARSLQQAEIVACVPVWRPLGPEVFSRWTFGIVRCRFGSETRSVPGLFDRLEIFSPAAVADAQVAGEEDDGES